MSHYVWQMNDGRWHISPQTNTTQPRLPCEWAGGHDTYASAATLLQKERNAARLIVATDDKGVDLFYTGRAGDGWVSLNRREAFVYLSDEGAARKAGVLADMTGIAFGVRALTV